MYDLIVVGAGLAGLFAAHSAAELGLKVKIVAKGLGATHWGAGGVDVLGYYPDSRTAVERPLQAIEALAAAEPAHPYALLEPGELRQALQDFLALAEDMGLPYGGADVAGENLWLPSPAGAARPAFLAPQAQLSGALKNDCPLLIVGWRGMRDFYPALIAANLSRQGYPARDAYLPMDLVTSRRDANTVHLAAELDNPARWGALASALKALVQPGERVGLPAVLGLEAHPTAWAELTAQVGAPVFEIPTLPPSVPGVRLTNALRRRLAAMGVRVELNDEVIGFGVEAGRVAWIETETSARPLRQRAGHYLLATGGILGGGIRTDHTGAVWETVLDLPVWAPEGREAWLRPRFLDPAGQPIFRAGVTVNRQFQPVDAGGAPVYANVWAAGGLLAHADPIRERSLDGIALATAAAAVRRLAKAR
jgi:glycerol-3-phosphate dehydrogenase subunit B